jgi:hypothetical protein
MWYNAVWSVECQADFQRTTRRYIPEDTTLQLIDWKEKIAKQSKNQISRQIPG